MEIHTSNARKFWTEMLRSIIDGMPDETLTELAEEFSKGESVLLLQIFPDNNVKVSMPELKSWQEFSDHIDQVSAEPST